MASGQVRRSQKVRETWGAVWERPRVGDAAGTETACPAMTRRTRRRRPRCRPYAPLRTWASQSGRPTEPCLRGRSRWLKVATPLVADTPKPSRIGASKRFSNSVRTSTGSDDPPATATGRLAAVLARSHRSASGWSRRAVTDPSSTGVLRKAVDGVVGVADARWARAGCGGAPVSAGEPCPGPEGAGVRCAGVYGPAL